MSFIFSAIAFWRGSFAWVFLMPFGKPFHLHWCGLPKPEKACSVDPAAIVLAQTTLRHKGTKTIRELLCLTQMIVFH